MNFYVAKLAHWRLLTMARWKLGQSLLKEPATKTMKKIRLLDFTLLANNVKAEWDLPFHRTPCALICFTRKIYDRSLIDQIKTQFAIFITRKSIAWRVRRKPHTNYCVHCFDRPSKMRFNVCNFAIKHNYSPGTKKRDSRAPCTVQFNPNCGTLLCPCWTNSGQ